MKVYILQYWNYEDSEVRGVYTYDAMMKEKEQYTQWGRERYAREIESKRKSISELNQKRDKVIEEERVILGNQHAARDAGHKDVEKKLQKMRKPLLKDIDNYAHQIHMLESTVKKLENLTDEELCNSWMSYEHISFEEFYVLGMPCECECAQKENGE